MESGEKWGVLYDLDRQIAAEDFFCVTPADRTACSDVADTGQCLRASTQMTPEAKVRLADCVEDWEVYTCIEGAANHLRPE